MQRMSRCIVRAVLAILVLAELSAAQPPRPREVFVSGRDGYHTCRIPALLATTLGTLLAFCEGRVKGSGDAGEIHTLVKRSTDGGTTWSPHTVVWSDGENSCGNPAPVLDQRSGTIWLLLTWNLGTDREDAIMKGTSKDTRRVFVTSSKDDGLTWAPPCEITASVKKPHWRWYATGPVNGIQLARGQHAGRMVVPANHSDHSDPKVHPYRAHGIYSDDGGQTWKLGGIEEPMTNESTLVELADGSLLHNMRSYHGKNRRAVARSKDGGLSWSEVELDPALVEPVCQASIIRHSWPSAEKPGKILFLNPASTRRERMTLRVSTDEARSWPVARVLHEGPAAYSCMAVMQDRSVACLFEAGEKSPYERIAFVHVAENELAPQPSAPR